MLNSLHWSRSLLFSTSFVAVLGQSPSTTSTVASPVPASNSAPSIASSTAPSTPPSTASVISNGSVTGSPGIASSAPPDVYLNVPQLSVGRIELDVENLEANLNLNAEVANLVSINAGVAVSVSNVNITIADVDAELELIVRLGNLVDIVNRTLASLDLNPLLINTLNNVTSAVDDIVGEVDGLLGSVTQGGATLNFVIDNLGNIVQQIAGGASTIVGDYLQNMTYTGEQQTLSGGLTQKTYSYAPLNALVNIVFNSLGQVVQATKASVTGGSSSSAAPSAAPTGSKRRV